jgi:proline racemase
VIRIRTIDAHAAGGALRLVVDGFPSPHGRTMLDKRDWLERHAGHLRRVLMLEPRGHADLSGAVLTEPVLPGSHAGVVFMDGDAYHGISGHGLLAVTTIALERGLILAEGGSRRLSIDTAAGTISADVTFGPASRGPEAAPGKRVAAVSVTTVPSFVFRAGEVVTVGSRAVRVDVAFGGAFYAIVDSESAGLPVDGAHLPELRRAGMAIARAVAARYDVVHPTDPGLRGLAGTVFTAPPSDERAALRNVVVFAGGRADRSPSGTGTAAVMAVLDAMGLLAEDVPFVHEGLIGTHLTGRVVGRTMVGDCPAIVPAISGTAWVTGEHTFVSEEDDPLAGGFRV